MNKQEFIAELAEELEVEVAVTLETELKDLDEWDSMGAMILIGYVSDNFNVTLNADDIEALTSFESLVDRIGEDKFV
ncbi:phosphopantetheine-binding protein [Tenacibaculum finnmarkense]|uniref:phosphopantetheine-binding protein n=1 Tax=Tenacibaculum finnmarkense TaxID=2781243 RepID=UPI001EFB494C|nr:phosphopantetheine-binding protein [Tenacibaculum finnmarkense]MCG8749740.1 acyl carrier protein [Tenacibaculum finnmarkense]